MIPALFPSGTILWAAAVTMTVITPGGPGIDTWTGVPLSPGRAAPTGGRQRGRHWSGPLTVRGIRDTNQETGMCYPEGLNSRKEILY